jgi:hypothetical protein
MEPFDWLSVLSVQITAAFPLSGSSATSNRSSSLLHGPRPAAQLGVVDTWTLNGTTKELPEIVLAFEK